MFFARKVSCITATLRQSSMGDCGEVSVRILEY